GDRRAHRAPGHKDPSKKPIWDTGPGRWSPRMQLDTTTFLSKLTQNGFLLKSQPSPLPQCPGVELPAGPTMRGSPWGAQCATEAPHCRAPRPQGAELFSLARGTAGNKLFCSQSW
ncbi:unnamed protein product, partial [Coccothraustes coccothraustes]